MEKELKFNDQYGPEDEKKLEDEMRREDKLEEELMPYVVDEIEKRIEKEGINEEEIDRIFKDLKNAGSRKSAEELRQEAILVWKEELIEQELEKQVRERLGK